MGKKEEKNSQALQHCKPHITRDDDATLARKAPNLPTTTRSTQRRRHTDGQRWALGSGPERAEVGGATGGFVSDGGGSCLEFLREIAGLSVLLHLQLVELATPCTNIEDLKP